MTTSRNTLRGVASLGIAGLALASLGVAATADVGPDQPGAPEEGTLTIHKYAGAPIGTHDGTELSGDALDGHELLGGVEFTIQRAGVLNDADECVALDLTDPDAWDAVPTDSAGDLAAEDLCAFGAPVVVTTEDDEVSAAFGTVTETLPVGLYYVTETDPGNNPIVEPALPFYVTIPMPTVIGDPEEYDWNYDVHVYPKNQLLGEPTKTIEDAPDGFTVGSNVTWNLSATVPTLNDADAEFEEASITDTLNDRLAYVSSVVSVDGTVVFSDVDGVDVDVADLVTRTGESVWTFTEEGLAFLTDNQDAEVTVVLVTTVTGGEGEISNGGDGLDNPAEFSFNNTSQPTPLAYTYWGQLAILKVDESDPQRTLAGAEFAVYALPEGATECPATPAGDVVSEGVSDADGVVIWTHADGNDRSPLNLWVENSNTPLVDPAKDYCVYETRAPAGYTATPEPQQVTITAGELTAAADLEWENAQQDGPNMPLTGAGGTLLLTVAGLVLIGAGVTSVIVTQKRRQKAQS